jgi:argininosuccinate synthase
MSFLPLLRLRFQPSRPILSSARILYKKIPNSTTTSLAVQGNAQSRTEEQYKALEKWSKTYAPVRPLQPDREAWVTDLRGNNIGITMLPGSVFSEPPRLYVVQQVLKWQLANRRKGNAWTKTKA